MTEQQELNDALRYERELGYGAGHKAALAVFEAKLNEYQAVCLYDIEQAEKSEAQMAAGFSADVENLRNFLAHERTIESNINDVYTPRLGRIYAALKGFREMEARVTELTEQLAIQKQENTMTEQQELNDALRYEHELGYSEGYKAALAALEAEQQRGQWEPVDALAALAATHPAANPVAPDWSQAPPWANWWAVDGMGATWFEVEPVADRGGDWTVGNNWDDMGEWGGAGEIDIPLGVDWRVLKQKRPGRGVER